MRSLWIQRFAAIGCCVAATAMPAWLEVHAVAEARAALGRCAGPDATCGSLGAIDVDVFGLRLVDVARDVGGVRVAAEQVRLDATFDGVRVTVRGVTLQRRPVASSPARASTAAGEPAKPRRLPSTHGIPVELVVEDAFTLPAVRGAEATIHGARARLDGEGGLTLSAHAEIEHALLRTPIRLRGSATMLDDLAHWQAEGDARVEADGAPMRIVASRQAEGASLSLDDGEGGRLDVRSQGSRAFTVQADAFALHLLSAVKSERKALGPALAGAKLSGGLEVDLADGPHVHADGVVLDGLTIDDRRLARHPVTISDLRIDGDAGLRPDGGFVDVVLARGDASLHLRARVDAEQGEVTVDVPAQSCQSVLAALPESMRDVLGGVRLSGELEGRVHATIDRAALAAIREVDLLTAEEPPPPPGTLAVHLPVLEACTIETDPVAVDLPALVGPYRHRWTSDAGRLQERVLASGAADFAPLASVWPIADAFVTLEDRRFWEHDGFDREQIERALWHNVARGGVYRGASTISQQTARNLWLGVDRSLARKLQEALLTVRLEATVPKRRILELYVNLIELGPDVHGVQAAARYWFDKPAAQVSVREAVHLAALAPAPNRFAKRFASGEVDAEWERMLDDHIRRMHRAGKIDERTLHQALGQRLTIVRHLD